MNNLKPNIKTFYFSVTAITILVLSVFIFMYLFGNLVDTKTQTPKKIYFADNISNSHKYAIEKFNELHKGKIEVVPIDLSFEKFQTNERKELLMRYLRSRSDRLDIFSVDQIWTPRFAKFVEPLSNYISTNERDNIIPYALESCFYKGQLVALPLYIDISIMYYRKDLLEKLHNYKEIKKQIDSSITWENFIKLGLQMKNTEMPFYLFQAEAFEGLMCSFVELIESQNSKILEGEPLKLNTPEANKALQLLVDLVNKYKLSPQDITNYKEYDTYYYFIDSGAIFLRGWPGFHKWYELKYNDKSFPQKVGIAPLPHFSYGSRKSIVGGWNLMISKYSTKKNEAVEFIKFLIQEDIQKKFYELGGYLPINKKIYEDKNYLSRNRELNFYKSIFKTYARRPFLEKYTRYSDIISYYLNRAIKNEISVKDALSLAEKNINTE
ncbi:extracellular solute-binding protein [Rosettibacter firmus]|uniref:extracellular solute-binding protein n=1 Tax=Rosettibacter firmus TaxID=3111522 RepID=UPI00336BB76D